jgi:hypothetical protein
LCAIGDLRHDAPAVLAITMMTRLTRLSLGVVFGLGALVCVAAFVASAASPEAQRGASAAGAPSTPRSDEAVMPQYDAERSLILPAAYREWVLVGSSLGLSYAEGAQGREMFHATLMEPTAYRHFTATDEFREGTMLALVLQGIGTDAPPARSGRFATTVLGVELAVKDGTRVPETWAYYSFGGPLSGGFRAAAAPQPKARCHDCHAEHAGRDMVFTQFYGLLNEAAPERR